MAGRDEPLRPQRWNEPPLTERELRILRGMIDEYDYRIQRSRFVHDLWNDGRTAAAAAAAFVIFALQTVELYLIVRGRR